MQYADFKIKTLKTNVLADIDILGSFDFYTTIVTLDSINSDDISILKREFKDFDFSEITPEFQINPRQYQILSKILPLGIHEYTHFLDATSTLWGFKHLQLMDHAYTCSAERGKTEQEFHKAKTFYNHCRNIRLPKYYTEIFKGNINEDSKSWDSATTIGVMFNSDGKPSNTPILFTRFSNNLGQPLVRSPLSTVSLLEASAMAQELKVSSDLIGKTSPEFFIVERHTFNQKLLDYIYNRHITEYSVCAHLIASSNGYSNIMLNYEMAAALIRVALNFPRAAFLKIFRKCPIDKILDIPKNHGFTTRGRTALENGNRGFLFFLLSKIIQKNQNFNCELEEKINHAINFIGIDPGNLNKMQAQEADLAKQNLMKSKVSTIRKLAEVGHANFTKIQSNSQIDFSKLHLPPVMLSDGTNIHIFNNKDNLLGDFSLDACFDELYPGQSWVERFAEACV